MNIGELIEKYGEQITNTLKIASEQVYDKLIWYTRVSGAINLAKTTIFGVIFVIYCLIAHKIFKKCDVYDDNGEDGILTLEDGILTLWLISIIIFIVFSLILTTLKDPIIKLVAPEFYLIDQIINSVNK